MKYLLILCLLLGGCAKQEFNMTKCVEKCSFPGWLACKDECERKDCQIKTTPVKINKTQYAQTKGCKIIECLKDGNVDDCGRDSCSYNTIQCGENIYWGWSIWNNADSEKTVFIEGNQYFLSCMFLDGACVYDFDVPDKQ